MPADRPQPPGPRRDWGAWGISLLNGVVGDYLHESGNGLAIEMALYEHGRPLAALPCNPRLCVLVHGLACTENIWDFQGPEPDAGQTTYGTLLQADFGYAPLYVRYNTGRSIASNGRALNALLDELLAACPVPVEDIVLIGHSMGGLVVRGACYRASHASSAWAGHVTRVFYLASPHDGAPLERLGHLTATVLESVPNPITRLLARIGNLRSQGVKDLRYGAWLDEGEAQAGEDPSIPLPAHARHYVVAGTLTQDAGHPVAHVLGDGLVVPPRAAGSGLENPRVPAGHVRIFPGMSHLQLAREPQVYRQIEAWMQEP